MGIRGHPGVGRQRGLPGGRGWSGPVSGGWLRGSWQGWGGWGGEVALGQRRGRRDIAGLGGWGYRALRLSPGEGALVAQVRALPFLPASENMKQLAKASSVMRGEGGGKLQGAAGSSPCSSPGSSRGLSPGSSPGSSPGTRRAGACACRARRAAGRGAGCGVRAPGKGSPRGGRWACQLLPGRPAPPPQPSWAGGTES